ncbi:MAG TPA: hypothetical protein VFM96_10135 [Gaiellaceae bacterium]|nr:hypothetical protein [Gaiellaceae bacterium]
MADTVTPVTDPASADSMLGVFDVATTSYPSGGIAVTGSSVNRKGTFFVVPVGNGAGAGWAEWDNANQKVKLFTAAGTEKVGGAASIRCLVIGPHA